MRDRFEEPFEFHVCTKNASASSRRPQESLRVGAFVLILGVSVLCAVFWPSHTKKASSDENVQKIASTGVHSQEEPTPDVNLEQRGGFEDLILNDRRADIEEISELELADASLIEIEETRAAESFEAAPEFIPQNRVASTGYEERQGNVQIAARSFETKVESKLDDEIEANVQAQVESTSEESVVKSRSDSRTEPKENKRSSTAARSPGYFARAANLPGRHNSFSLRNFARAANLVESSGVYSPRSLTNAAQVDDLDVEAR